MRLLPIIRVRQCEPLDLKFGRHTAAVCRVAHSDRYAHFQGRAGFTLIELLVVITISLILLAATALTVNYSMNADRVRSAARQFQSFVAGARDKAIHANDIRGVRLLVDPNNNHTVTGMQYIGSPKQESSTNGGVNLILDTTPATLTPSGTTLPAADTTGHTVMLAPPSGASSPYPVNRWKLLKNQGYLQVGCRIQIPNVTGPWYTVVAITIDTANNNNPKLVLNKPVAALQNSSAIFASYTLQLYPAVLGDSQPVLFPRGVVIDLDGSSVPGSWRPTSGYSSGVSQSYSPQMDILFSPRGTVVGDCAGIGIAHFHFADSGDVVNWNANNLLNGRNQTNYNTSTYPLPVVPANNSYASPALVVVTKDRLLASLATLTGNVGVYYVNETVLSTNTTTPIANDPYSFAETGQVANK